MSFWTTEMFVLFTVEDGADSTVQPIPEADDEEYVNFNELPQPRASVKPLPPVPVKKSAPHRNPAPFNSQAEPTDHIGIAILILHFLNIKYHETTEKP